MQRSRAWLSCVLLSAACSSEALVAHVKGPKPVSCEHDAECDDGLVCSGLERCLEGRCWSGRPPRCDDADPCTRDLCVEPRGCRGVPSQLCEMDASLPLQDATARADDGSAEAATPVTDANGFGFVARPPEDCRGGLLVGDVIATAQATLAALSDVTCIDGDLSISGIGVQTLTPLAALRWVGGNITIAAPTLESLAGLDALRYVEGSLTIDNIRGSAIMSVFPKLEVVENQLRLAGWARLQRLDGFYALGWVGGALEITQPALVEFGTVFGALGRVGASLSVSAPKLSKLDSFNALAKVGMDLKLEAPLLELRGFRQLEIVPNAITLPATLTSLAAFERLRSAGTLALAAHELRTLDGFPALSKVGSLNLSGANLERIDGFGALREVSALSLSNLPKITTLTALSSLTSANFLELTQTGLSALPFSNLRTCSSLTLINNPVLGDLSALSGAGALIHLSVSGNPALRSLAPLRVASSVNTLSIKENLTLSELGLSALTQIESSLSIVANPNLSRCAADELASKLLVTRGSTKEVCCNQGCQQCDQTRCIEPGGIAAGQSTRANTIAPSKTGDLRAYVHVESTGSLKLDGYVGPVAALPNLKQVTGSFELLALGWRDLEPFALLEEVDGDLRIASCNQLPSLAGLRALRSVGRRLAIASNAVLRDVRLPALQEAKEGVQIERNPLLSVCQTDLLQAQLPAYTSPNVRFAASANPCGGSCVEGMCQ